MEIVADAYDRCIDPQRRTMTDDHLYRRGVGVMLINADGLVWVGRRIDNRDEAWQMPQGGLDKGEDRWAGALRELEEETGIAPHLVEQVACHPQQLRYDIPEAIASQPVGRQMEGAGAGLVSGALPRRPTTTSTSPPSIPSSAIGNGSSRICSPN